MSTDAAAPRSSSNPTTAMMRDLIALQVLSRLGPAFLPWTNSAMRPSAIQLLLNDITLNRRRTIVEFGSGLSTVYFAALAVESHRRMLTIDHNRGWLGHVQSWLTEEQRRSIKFVHAPLVKTSYQGTTVDWYDRDIVQAALGEFGTKIDLVVVDGPPAYQQENFLARGPAAEAVLPHLSHAVTLALDDISRPGEQQVAAHWNSLLGSPYRDLAEETGLALWTIGSSHNIVP